MQLLLRSVSATSPIGWIERSHPSCYTRHANSYVAHWRFADAYFPPPFWSQGLRARWAASDGLLVETLPDRGMPRARRRAN